MTDTNTNDTDDLFDGEERGRIKYHAHHGRMAPLLRVIGADTRMGIEEHFADEGIEGPLDLFDHYAEHGDFTTVDGIGAGTSERVERALPVIREELGLDVDLEQHNESDNANDNASESESESREMTLSEFGIEAGGGD